MDADKEVGESLWDLRADRSEYPTSEEVPVGAAAASVSAERNGKSSTEEALAKLVVEEANTVPLEEVEVEAMDGVQLEEPSNMDLATKNADSSTADVAVPSPVIEIEVHSAEEFLQRLIEQSRRIAFEFEVEFGRDLGWESRWNALIDTAQAVSAKNGGLEAFPGRLETG